MGAFIQNPRHFPRLAARCRVVVSHAGAGWSAETVDVSATGCQIVSPRPLRPGETAKLVIEAPQISVPLSVFGRVAWSSERGRIRAGVAFAERQPDGDPTAWFRRLLACQPGVEGALRRVPDRLPHDTKLFLRPPPQFIFDFGPDEVTLLRLLGDGTTVGNLLRTGAFPDDRAARLVFALLEQRVITLSLGEAAPAWRWKAALADFETQAGERRPPPPAPPRAAPSAPPIAAPSVQSMATPPVAVRPPPPPARPAPPPRSGAPVEARVEATVPVPAAPTPARSSTPRGPEAQECFDLAVSAVSMGEISTAIGLLRRALQLSPRDPEISALLGQLAFRDRMVRDQ